MKRALKDEFEGHGYYDDLAFNMLVDDAIFISYAISDTMDFSMMLMLMRHVTQFLVFILIVILVER